MTPEVIPWMSPCLSQSMSFVLAGIGHPMKFRRGDVIYTSPGLFGNLMYVRSGFCGEGSAGSSEGRAPASVDGGARRAVRQL